MPRPRAGDWLDDEIAGWRAEGIGVIVSLLEAGEVRELGLHREPSLCHDLDMEFIAFPVPDGGVPLSTGDTLALAKAIVARLNEGKAVAVHCRAGIGRSSLIAACVLVLLGFAPGMAFDLIGKARGASRSRIPKDNETRSRGFMNSRRPAASIRPDAMRRSWRLSYYSRIAEASGSAPAPEHAGGVSFQMSPRGTPTERIWCER